MQGPTNLFGQPVNVGDYVVLTTMSGKAVRTRIAKVVRIEQGAEKRNWDAVNRVYVPTGTYYYRTFVRLYKEQTHFDRTLRVFLPKTLRGYTKEVFGIRDSVKIDPSIIPQDILEVLDAVKR